MSKLQILGLILFAPLFVLFVIGRMQMASWESVANANEPIGAHAKFVETRSGRVHVLDQGEGPVIMLMHGTGRSIADWQEGLADRLAKTHRVVAFDYYGHGLSDRGKGLRYGHVLWAQQAIDLMDAMGIVRASIVGHSTGGVVVSRVAVKYPDRIERVVIMGTGVAMDPMQILPFIPGVGEFVMGRTVMFTDTFSARHERAMEAAYAIQGTRRGLLVYIRRQYTIDGVELLFGIFDEIEAPVLQIHGELDASIPLQAGRELSKRTGAEFIEVPGASHDVHIDAKDFVADKILSFVS
jgi:2-hydroxymuconate-semialdehyde hydrolase